MNKLKLASIGLQISARSTRMFLKHAPATVSEYAAFFNKFFGIFSKPDSKKDLYTQKDLDGHKTSLMYNICYENSSINSKDMIVYLANKYDNEKADIDLYQPTVVPLHENSINLFTGGPNTDAYFSLRKFDPLNMVAVFGLTKTLIFSKFYPTVAMLMLPSYMIFGYGTFTVSRADLLPHQEAVSFERIGWRGNRYYEIVKISDLKKCNRDEGNTAYMLARYSHGFDASLMFTDIVTHKVYAFDIHGHWNGETLNHELLN